MSANASMEQTLGIPSKDVQAAPSAINRESWDSSRGSAMKVDLRNVPPPETRESIEAKQRAERHRKSIFVPVEDKTRAALAELQDLEELASSSVAASSKRRNAGSRGGSRSGLDSRGSNSRKAMIDAAKIAEMQRVYGDTLDQPMANTHQKGKSNSQMADLRALGNSA